MPKKTEDGPFSTPSREVHGAILDPMQLQYMYLLFGAHPWSYYKATPEEMLAAFDPPQPEENK
jgi:hypothetical protein